MGKVDVIETRQREIVRHLWRDGRLSRWELHERTGLTPNGVGSTAEALLKLGILRECAAEPSSGGRPRVPLEIDPGQRNVVGLSIAPGQVEAGRLGLRGHALGRHVSKAVEDPRQMVTAAKNLMKQVVNDETLAVGVSVTGFVDPESRSILFSSAVPGRGAVSLQAVYDAAGERPVLLENDMHALAARWLLTHRAQADQDVLLVSIDDGRLGAAILIEGRPNRGCAIAANELGHTRFFVDTEKCYCGHPGCLERIFSTDFLHRQGAAADIPLADQVARFEGSTVAEGTVDADSPMRAMLKYVSMGIANAVNFVRPDRLVLVSPLMRHAPFAEALQRQIRGYVLMELADRVRIDLWDQPAARSAETAGWLALASLYCEGWLGSGAKRRSQPN